MKTPETLLSARLDCPRCGERPITTRSPRGEHERTWCMGCHLHATVAGGCSATAWNAMVEAIVGEAETDDPAGQVREIPVQYP